MKIDAKAIPSEARRAFFDALRADQTHIEAFAACLAAWPGVGDDYPGDGTPCIILPLTKQETRDD